MAEEQEKIEKDDQFIGIQIKRDMLHTKLGSHLPFGSLMLMEGKDGAGKSIMVQRLTLSFLLNNASVTYISSELSTKDFLEQMDSLDYGIDKYLIGGKLLFIPMFPFIGGGKLRDDFLERFLAAEPLFKQEIIIVDTMSCLLVQGNISEEQAYDTVKFFKKIANKGKLVIFTVDPAQLNKKLLDLLRSVSDIYISFDEKKLGGEVKKFMQINRFKKAKMKYTPQVAFRVEPKQGIIIDIGGLA
ncbi:MAG: ATPase [Candidatus Altiarchaeota archaeon]|nr:ATPase [Candidatus Altiarchaeota archaeon]